MEKVPDSSKHRHDDDLILTRAVAGGSLQAWHSFLEQYTGLISNVVRRHLYAEDEDTVRTVFVDILKKLYDGGINKFRGDSSLSTWLIVFARSGAYDYVRKKRGRHREPAGLKNLSRLDQKVFRYFYVEKLPLDIVVHVLKWSGFDATAEEIVDSLQRIEVAIDSRTLARLDNECKAKIHGVDSSRMLKCLVHIRQEYEDKVHGNRPDAHAIEEEARRTETKVREKVAQLTSEEQKVIFLRYNRRLTAQSIARRLGLENERRAYTIINRALRKLRRSIELEKIE